MENRDFITKKYNKKIKELNKHNKLYYSKDKPIISDKEYDELKKKIIELENKYNYLKNKDSTSQNVGFKPSKTFR